MEEPPSERSPLPISVYSMQTWNDKLAAMKGSGLVLDLPTLIALARVHMLSPEEMESIRKAWVVRELQLQQPQLKKNRAEALYEEAKKKAGL
jgi:hypothetical protein